MGITKIITTGILMVACLSTAAQQVQKVKEVLTSISNVYDTTQYLSFDIQYTYSTDDTIKGSSKGDQMKGTYTIQQKNAAYSLGQMECIQNDSFFVAVYKTDKFIIVSKPSGNANTRFFPMRETMDSLLNLSSEKYIIDLGESVSKPIKKITFKAKDSTEKVDLFEIQYNAKTMLLMSLLYRYHEYELSHDESSEGVPQLRNKAMLMEFSNTRSGKLDADFFDERKYIFFRNNECIPAEKYDVYYIKPANENLKLKVAKH
jgi:hypothetical protein